MVKATSEVAYDAADTDADTLVLPLLLVMKHGQ